MEILTNEEKTNLLDTVKDYVDFIETITKVEEDNGILLDIQYTEEALDMPDFCLPSLWFPGTKDLFKGMEPDKAYTLEELDLY